MEVVTEVITESPAEEDFSEAVAPEAPVEVEVEVAEEHAVEIPIAQELAPRLNGSSYLRTLSEKPRILLQSPRTGIGHQSPSRRSHVPLRSQRRHSRLLSKQNFWIRKSLFLRSNAMVSIEQNLMDSFRLRSPSTVGTWATVYARV
jgi:hypothetical protein